MNEFCVYESVEVIVRVCLGGGGIIHRGEIRMGSFKWGWDHSYRVGLGCNRNVSSIGIRMLGMNVFMLLGCVCANVSSICECGRCSMGDRARGEKGELVVWLVLACPRIGLWVGYVL